jgi:hypothetical protein
MLLSRIVTVEGCLSASVVTVSFHLAAFVSCVYGPICPLAFPARASIASHNEFIAEQLDETRSRRDIAAYIQATARAQTAGFEVFEDARLAVKVLAGRTDPGLAEGSMADRTQQIGDALKAGIVLETHRP